MQRQKSDLPFPFTLDAALRQEQYFFDSDADRYILPHFKYAGHRESCRYSFVSESRHRTRVVGEQYPSFARRPGKYLTVVGATDPGILLTTNVEVGLTP